MSDNDTKQDMFEDKPVINRFIDECGAEHIETEDSLFISVKHQLGYKKQLDLMTKSRASMLCKLMTFFRKLRYKFF